MREKRVADRGRPAGSRGGGIESAVASIDTCLARGQTALAPPFRLALLSRGRLGPVLGGRLANTLR
jgi:hypothetical protein